MSAVTILTHASLLFYAFGTLVYFGKRLPAAERRSGQDRRQQPRHTPNQKVSDVVDTPRDVVNRLIALREATLSWLDVDVAYCTDEELRTCMIRVLAHARADDLSDQEMSKFWSIKAEMDRRQYHPPLSGGVA